MAPKANMGMDDILAKINKDHGEGSIMYLDKANMRHIHRTSSGSLHLDYALGGGIPKGRIVEIYGPESSGKTTVALHCIANAQREGQQCAFIDAEHALDPVYAKKLGVDTDKLLISQPDTGEQALEIADALAVSGHIGLIVVDSVAALVPKAEIEGEMGDSHVGLQARLMSQALRKLTGPAEKNGCTLVFINQLREKIGVMFGSPETTTGGKALKFYASVRIDVRRIETLKDGSDPIGNRTRAKIVKNKVAPPFKQAEFNILYGQGVDPYVEVLEAAVAAKEVQKSGSWYTHKGEQLGQGSANATKTLREDPDLYAELYAVARKHLGLSGTADEAPEDDAGTDGAAPAPENGKG